MGEPRLQFDPTRRRRGWEATRGFWTMAGLEAIETRVIRIPVRYADFDDFWNSNTVPIGP